MNPMVTAARSKAALKMTKGGVKSYYSKFNEYNSEYKKIEKLENSNSGSSS